MSGRPEPLDLVAWSADVLKGLGAQPRTDGLVGLVAWALIEGGHIGNDAAWNPLNTTLRRPGSTSMNRVGVQRYRSYGDGLAATLTTLRLAAYTRVVAALRSSAPPTTLADAVGASPWGTSAAGIRGTISRARAMVAAHSPLAATYTAATPAPTSAARIPRVFPYVDTGPQLAAVRLNGAGLAANIVDATTRAALSVSTSEATQLELTVEDPDLRILAAGIFRTRALVTYGPLDLEVAALEVHGGSAGRGGLTITARPRGVQALRRTYGLAMANASPTTFAADCARRAGLLFVGEPSAARPTIALEAEPGQPREDAWTGLARLADELGFVCYEAAGVLYFARPRWLVGVLPPHTVAWRYGATDGRILGHPVCRRTVDDPAAEVTVELKVVAELGERFLTGSALHLEGVPTFVGRYAVTSASVDLAAAEGAITITAATPIDPEPNPPEAPAATDGAATYTAAPTSSAAGWVHPLRGQGRDARNFGQDRGTHRHAGTDIGAATGTQIYAARAGEVTFSGAAGSYGNLVKIGHADGFETRYAHQVRTPPVRVGQRVAAGELIGHVGSTGRSTGPHLHFEVRRNGAPIDPSPLIG